jgi:CRP/FNR family transcriptional regulator, cyclic AMP receptor protein
VDAVRVLRETSVFRDLTAEQLAPLLAIVRRQEYKRGGHVWDEGDPANALHVLVSGQVKLFRLSRAGGQIITQVISPGEAFGHPGLFLAAGRRGTSGEALEPSVCLSIAREPLLEFLERNPRAMRRMLEGLAEICWNITAVLTDATFQDMRARVARMLLSLADSRGEPAAPGIRIAIKLSQGTLAGLIGASRENVNRALAYFITNGDVRHDDGYFTILRADELRQELADEHED